MIKILLADDHELVREGLKKLLSTERDLIIVDEAASAGKVIEIVRTKLVDLVVLDISMPGMAGLEILKEIKKSKQRPKVLILSMLPAELFAVRAIKAGADGYLSKEGSMNEMARAIRAVAGGQKYFSPSIVQTLAEEIKLGHEHHMPHEVLADREFEVFRLLASGQKVHAIADLLNICVATVHTHRARIMGKMNLKSNSDLTQYAVRNGLIDLLALVLIPGCYSSLHSFFTSF